MTVTVGAAGGAVTATGLPEAFAPGDGGCAGDRDASGPLVDGTCAGTDATVVAVVRVGAVMGQLSAGSTVPPGAATVAVFAGGAAAENGVVVRDARAVTAVAVTTSGDGVGVAAIGPGVGVGGSIVSVGVAVSVP